MQEMVNIFIFGKKYSVPGSSMKEEPVWTMAHLEKILSWKDLISRVFRGTLSICSWAESHI